MLSWANVNISTIYSMFFMGGSIIDYVKDSFSFNLRPIELVHHPLFQETA